MAAVSIERAAAAQRAAIENMLQLYTHDFSQFWSGRDERGELGEDGRFDPYPYLDLYWREPDATPLLIRADGRLAGFALINRVFHSGRAADWSVAEFFVARKHRRAGIGLEAARQVFAAQPGLWEAAAAAPNLAAQAFWRRVSARYRDIEEIAADGPDSGSEPAPAQLAQAAWNAHLDRGVSHRRAPFQRPIMSRAFVKEFDDGAFEDLPERPISPHRNLVTAEGLAAMDAEIARLRDELNIARNAGDKHAEARAYRDLRYWLARHASAELVPAPQTHDIVQFGACVAIERDGRRETYRIVGEDEADPARGAISYVSPMAQALMGKAEGDTARVAGKDIEIVAIN